MKPKVEIVDEKDRNRGLITAAVFGAVLLILLLFLSVSEPDPPLKDIPVVIELTPEMIIEPSSSGSGGGAAEASSDRPDPTPPDAGDKVLTSNTPKPVQHNSGQGSTKPVTNPNPPNPQPDPTFSFGGGGQNGGGGSGNGPGFGHGQGDPGPGGDGTNNTGGGNRSVVQRACRPDFYGDEGKVVLRIVVDYTGKVKSATNVSAQSTLTSTSAINAARRAVLDCMKYDTRPSGTPDYTTTVTIQISAH
jgi:hypothetical protein